MKISIHAPLAGRDGVPNPERPLRQDFNPRAPCGVRRLDLVDGDGHLVISIHAPLAGCDSFTLAIVSPSLPFQSTHPLRGATKPPEQPPPPSLFQSTHPLRGATALFDRARLSDRISIHAPLAGCDLVTGLLSALPDLFQSTHPLRGATVAAHGGARFLDISIHAPLAGCDRRARRAAAPRMDFNPRTPCGVRHGMIASLSVSGHFNPRTPCGVRRRCRACFWNSIQFQSTHPLRGATECSEIKYAGYKISIHAPLAGCDGSIVL